MIWARDILVFAYYAAAAFAAAAVATATDAIRPQSSEGAQQN